jgi:hypothetical protein
MTLFRSKKKENEEISQLENSRKVVRKYSDFYLDHPCLQNSSEAAWSGVNSKIVSPDQDFAEI